MTRLQRNYSVFIVGYIVIISLTYINSFQETAMPFSLLFLPLIILAGYWEDTIGALWITGAAAITMVGLNFMKIIEPTHAMISVICFGIIFVLVVLINYDREKKGRDQQQELEPREFDLAAVKHKAFIAREQIERYEKRLKGLAKLYEVSKVLGTILELKTMLDEARLIVAQIMQHHFKLSNKESARLAIYIPSEDTNGFLRIGSRGLEVSDEGFPETISAQELKQWLGEDFNSIRITDVLEEKRYQTFSRVATFRSIIAIPLLMKDIVIGVLIMGANQPECFSANDFNTLEVLCKQIVLAVRRSLLYRQVQKLSFTDSQTGLYVHRFFQERLYEEIIRSNRYHQELSLLMMDLDHFKEINDNYGHQIGDLVLVEAAKRIKIAAGKTAFVARYGGEEFAAILPNCSEAEAFKIGELINQAVKDKPIQTEEHELAIKISIGISSLSQGTRDQENLLRHADLALYQAKRAGRDCVIKFVAEE